MAKQFLDKNGLVTFFNQLKNIFATKEYLSDVKESTDPYIFDIDYSLLEFNTDFVITGGTTSGTLGVGSLGVMILGNG